MQKKNKFGSSSQFLVVLLNFMAIFWRCQMHQVHVPSHHPQPLQTPRRGPVHDPHGVHCWLPVRPPHNDLGFVAVWRYAPLLRSKFFPSFIMELSQLAPPKELRYANIYIYTNLHRCRLMHWILSIKLSVSQDLRDSMLFWLWHVNIRSFRGGGSSLVTFQKKHHHETITRSFLFWTRVWGI